MPSEKTMRRVKDDLTKRMARQQQIGGVKVQNSTEDHEALHGTALPNVTAIHEYLDPILRKVDVDEEEDRHTPAPPSPPREDREIDLGETTPGIKDKLVVKHQGTYDWNLRTDAVRALPGSYVPSRPKKESVETIAARHRIRFLKQLPEWREKLENTFWTSGNKDERELKLREVLESSNRLFGDWRKPRERKLSIFGRMQ